MNAAGGSRSRDRPPWQHVSWLPASTGSPGAPKLEGRRHGVASNEGWPPYRPVRSDRVPRARGAGGGAEQTRAGGGDAPRRLRGAAGASRRGGDRGQPDRRGRPRRPDPDSAGRRGHRHQRAGDDAGDDRPARPSGGPWTRLLRPLVFLARGGGNFHSTSNGNLGEAAPPRRSHHRRGSCGAARSQYLRAGPDRPRGDPRRPDADERPLDHQRGQVLAGGVPDRRLVPRGGVRGSGAAR